MRLTSIKQRIIQNYWTNAKTWPTLLSFRSYSQIKIAFTSEIKDYPCKQTLRHLTTDSWHLTTPQLSMGFSPQLGVNRGGLLADGEVFTAILMSSSELHISCLWLMKKQLLTCSRYNFWLWVLFLRCLLKCPLN